MPSTVLRCTDMVTLPRSPAKFQPPTRPKLVARHVAVFELAVLAERLTPSKFFFSLTFTTPAMASAAVGGRAADGQVVDAVDENRWG